MSCVLSQHHDTTQVLPAKRERLRSHTTCGGGKGPEGPGAGQEKLSPHRPTLSRDRLDFHSGTATEAGRGGSWQSRTRKGCMVGPHSPRPQAWQQPPHSTSTCLHLQHLLHTPAQVSPELRPLPRIQAKVCPSCPILTHSPVARVQLPIPRTT